MVLTNHTDMVENPPPVKGSHDPYRSRYNE